MSAGAAAALPFSLCLLWRRAPWSPGLQTGLRAAARTPRPSTAPQGGSAVRVRGLPSAGSALSGRSSAGGLAPGELCPGAAPSVGPAGGGVRGRVLGPRRGDPGVPVPALPALALCARGSANSCVARHPRTQSPRGPLSSKLTSLEART